MSNLIAFDIPESPEEIAKWLESIICEGDLRGLVTQLISVHGATGQESNLDAILAEHRQGVMDHGLSALSESKVQSLLVTPTLLLQLQETIMAEGGEYWLGKFNSDASRDTVRRTDDVVAQVLGSQQVTIDRTEKPDSPRTGSSLLALAAGLLIAIGGTWYWNQQRGDRGLVQVAAGWGWASESGIPSDVSAKEYLTALSSGADAWFNKRPSNESELATRLTEFSAGCERLINANHAPLAKADEAWLQYKCRGWKKRIDEQLAAVDQNPVEDVLRATDAIAKEVSEALTERATQV